VPSLDGSSGAFGTPADVTQGTAFSLGTGTMTVLVNTAPVLALG
jgi:hypothetical protein